MPVVSGNCLQVPWITRKHALGFAFSFYSVHVAPTYSCTVTEPPAVRCLLCSVQSQPASSPVLIPTCRCQLSVCPVFLTPYSPLLSLQLWNKMRKYHEKWSETNVFFWTRGQCSRTDVPHQGSVSRQTEHSHLRLGLWLLSLCGELTRWKGLRLFIMIMCFLNETLILQKKKKGIRCKIMKLWICSTLLVLKFVINTKILY